MAGSWQLSSGGAETAETPLKLTPLCLNADSLVLNIYYEQYYPRPSLRRRRAGLVDGVVDGG